MYNNYYIIFPYDKNPTNGLKLELLLTSMKMYYSHLICPINYKLILTGRNSKTQ